MVPVQLWPAILQVNEPENAGVPCASDRIDNSKTADKINRVKKAFFIMLCCLMRLLKLTVTRY